MREWTPAARDEFERYCESVREKLATDGADPAEVFEDLRGHVDREAEAGEFQPLTREHLQQILSRVGPLGDRPISQLEPVPPLPPRKRPLESRVWFQWAGGVVLPVVAIVVETISGWCASTFFDPLPTPAHVFLASLVPAANAWLLQRLESRATDRPARMTAAAGAAVGMALLYTIPFLLLLPIAVIGLLFFGLGLLPLSPPLALVASLRIADRVRREAPSGAWSPRPFLYGFGAAIFAFVLADLPKTVTHVGMRMANAADSARAQRGVALLRSLGSVNYLLRACYDRSGVPLDLVTFALQSVLSDPVEPAEARAIFYRVTGRAFNTLPAPFVSRIRGGDPTEFWDFDQASTAIGAPLKGLSLSSSRLDGSVDSDAALAYIEWTLEFKNYGVRPSEARAQVALPPGAVVSRVTLWIGEEEREAAFGGRGEVRQAYERVVQARRDPILVTTSGPDQILVQCFPVNPGAVMKARLGITAPLLIETLSQGALVLPHFRDRNFAVRQELNHSVWIETKGRFAAASAPYALETLAAGGQALRADISNSALAGDARTITVNRDPSRLEAWALPEGADPAIRQTLRPRAPAPAKRLVVVLDGSRSAAPAGPALAAALRHLPASTEVALVLASDEATVIAGPRPGGEAAALSAARVAFVGGADNVPALVQAWELAAGAPKGVILWVHGPQPERMRGADTLAQRLARRPEGARLVALAVEDGPNRVLEELGDVAAVSISPRRGALAADLESALDHAVGAATPIEAVRETTARVPNSSTASTSSHIRRLWASDQVRTAVAAGDAGSRKTALEIAIANRVVTPISGAVVLETQAQYKEAGLQPADAQTIPTIPEPETWLLLMVIACVLAWLLRSRRREHLA